MSRFHRLVVLAPHETFADLDLHRRHLRAAVGRAAGPSELRQQLREGDQHRDRRRRRVRAGGRAAEAEPASSVRWRAPHVRRAPSVAHSRAIRSPRPAPRRSPPAAGRGARARSPPTAATFSATPRAASAAAPRAARPTIRPAPTRPACCSGACTGGKCQPLNTTCLTAGNPCTATDGGAGGCCSGLCSGGKCVLGASFCIQPGDVCARDLDCCGGFCSKASGATAGRLHGRGDDRHRQLHARRRPLQRLRQLLQQELRPLGAHRRARLPAGPRLQDPEQPLHQRQRVLRRRQRHRVHCTPATSGNVSIGVCSMNTGNQVPGGICKLTGGANACSNAESDCACVVSPKAQCCAYDTLGLPRCLGSGRLRRRRWRDGHLQRNRSQLLPEAGTDVQHRRRVLRPLALRPRLDRYAALPDHDAQRRRHRLRGERRRLHGHRRLLHRPRLQHRRRRGPGPAARRPRRRPPTPASAPSTARPATPAPPAATASSAPTRRPTASATASRAAPVTTRS